MHPRTESCSSLVYVANSIVPSQTANSIHVMKMCAAFARQGIDVDLIVPARPERLRSTSNLFEYYGVDPSFKILVLPWSRLPGRGYSFAWGAAQSAQSLRPSLVYGRMVQACYLSVIRGIPTIFESHSPISDFGKVGVWMFRRMIRQKEFRTLVVISNALRSHYEQNYPELIGKIKTAPDGADPLPVAHLCETTAEGNVKRVSVGYVGHMYPGRGIEVIVELSKLCPWADFHAIGGMPKDVESWRERCGDRQNITFHGFCPPSEVYASMRKFDVVLAPYQRTVAVHGGKYDTSRWMSPLKVFEYMAAGKAIIASDLPVLREILTEENAMLVDPEDMSGWVDALSALRRRELRERLGKKALCDFMSLYTWQRRAEQVLA